MRAVEITKAGAPLPLVGRPIPQPAAGQGTSKFRPAACATAIRCCWKEGHWPGVQYPRVPGHEVAGVIDAVGSGVQGWSARPAASGRWLVRRPLRLLRAMPAGKICRVCQRPDHRVAL